jgi:hypothetical protein
MGFICAKWIRLDDGCVARCDKDHTHQGRHLDSIIDICWPDNDPRMKANMSATTVAGNAACARSAILPVIARAAMLAAPSREWE